MYKAVIWQRGKQNKRSADQTMSAFSMSKALFKAMEEPGQDLQMDRSNFIRYCLAKELKHLGIKVTERESAYGKKNERYG